MNDTELLKFYEENAHKYVVLLKNMEHTYVTLEDLYQMFKIKGKKENECC